MKKILGTILLVKIAYWSIYSIFLTYDYGKNSKYIKELNNHELTLLVVFWCVIAFLFVFILNKLIAWIYEK